MTRPTKQSANRQALATFWQGSDAQVSFAAFKRRLDALKTNPDALARLIDVQAAMPVLQLSYPAIVKLKAKDPPKHPFSVKPAVKQPKRAQGRPRADEPALVVVKNTKRGKPAATATLGQVLAWFDQLIRCGHIKEPMPPWLQPDYVMHRSLAAQPFMVVHNKKENSTLVAGVLFGESEVADMVARRDTAVEFLTFDQALRQPWEDAGERALWAEAYVEQQRVEGAELIKLAAEQQAQDLDADTPAPPRQSREVRRP